MERFESLTKIRPYVSFNESYIFEYKQILKWSIHKLQTSGLPTSKHSHLILFTIDYKHIFIVKKHNYLHNNLGMFALLYSNQ